MKLIEIGQAVRYKPGSGTYGYEDALESDGRLPGVVIGMTRPRRDGPSRARVRLTLAKRGGCIITRCVDVASLNHEA